MFIAIDIGNSSIKVGVFAGELSTCLIETHPLRTPSEYAKRLGGLLKEGGHEPRGGHIGVAISSVVPGHTEALRAGAMELTGAEPLIAGPGASGGLVLDVMDPAELGPDRIAVCVGAEALLGTPLAVVDFGTATTVNFVLAGGVFKGGAILPGLGLMTGALAGGTARLPDVKPQRPVEVMGRDTLQCILSGTVIGSAGAVERIIAEAEATEGVSFRVAATGGGMETVRPWLTRVEAFDADLTLKGLKIIYGRSSNA